MKGLFVEEIGSEGPVQGVFWVARKELCTTRNGSPYLALTLMDRTGSVEARVWDGVEELKGRFSEGELVRVTAHAKPFRGVMQLRIQELEPVEPSELDPAHFWPVTPEDREALWAEFVRLARLVKSPPLALIMKGVLRPDSPLAHEIQRAPAAKRLHHAYLGGLLEHSVGVGRLAREVCRLYPRLDRELLVAGALLHDLGKIRELDYSSPLFDYTDEGRLVGHIGLGLEILEGLAREAGVDRRHPRLTELKHLILSHHGQKEMGSPVVPMTEEAVVLNFLDELDSKLNYLRGLGRNLEGEGRCWTPFQRLYDRFFFLNPAADAGDEGPDRVEETGSPDRPATGSTSLGQRSLWEAGE